jgi:hypothetical protein
VWEPDDARFGVMKGQRLVVGGATGAWSCFDTASDPREKAAHPATWCGDLLDIARTEFGDVGRPR